MPRCSSARVGDRAAFEELVRRHADRLYAVLRFLCDRQEAEEVTQEAFLRAWRDRPLCGPVRVLHLAVSDRDQRGHRRAERRSPTEQSISLDEQPTAAPTDRRDEPQRRVEQRDLRLALERAVRAQGRPTARASAIVCAHHRVGPRGADRQPRSGVDAHHVPRVAPHWAWGRPAQSCRCPTSRSSRSRRRLRHQRAAGLGSASRPCSLLRVGAGRYLGRPRISTHCALGPGSSADASARRIPARPPGSKGAG
jgi:DNA-directed RNA polymerase specialized sigma24 family protein